MLRSGVVLFIVSSLGVALRYMEFDLFTGPMFKLICSFTLMGSVSCLLGTYCVTEYARPIRK
jgi:hypothetical protein